MAAADIAAPKQPGIESKVLDLVTQAQCIPDITPENHFYEPACELVKACKQLEKAIEEEYDPNIKNAHTTWKGLIESKKKHLDPVAAAREALSRKIIDFQRKQETIRKQEELRLQHEAQRAAEAAAKESAEEQQLADAIAAEQSGDKAAAEEILAAPVAAPPVYVPPVVVPRSTPKAAGISSRTNWKADVVAPDLVPREFLCVDEAKLGQYAKAMKDAAKVPGVRFYDAGSLAIKA